MRSRACSNCAMWSPIGTHGRGTTTGFCTHSSVGKVTRGADACPLFVSHDGAGFDQNVSFAAFQRMREGKAPPAFHYRNANQVDTDELRRRSARANARRIA